MRPTETEQLVQGQVLARPYPVSSSDPWSSQHEVQSRQGETEKQKYHLLLRFLLCQPTGGPTVGCLPLNLPGLRKLRFSRRISSEPGTHTLGGVVREVQLWAKLAEQSSRDVGPNQFLCQGTVKKVTDSLGKGKFSLKCIP